ncbi:MAG: stage V sporulation protein D (sporulation-specific penicillin-binding protein) [Parcubacteria group bacterium Gr01-1014_3]|nr:MAG: stage V sporulation protein D (sporulation-specific penicillin-binding protein) [Parcubacteria group bacterium Gr01-1014_3]
MFRYWIIIGLIIVSYSALAFNMYDLQIDKTGYYLAKAAARGNLGSILNPERRGIYFTDRNGNEIPVALNKEYPVIYGVPIEIDDAAEAATALSPVLGIEVGKLQTILSKPNSQYALLEAKATDTQVEKIKELGIRGIHIESEMFRFYPFENLAAQLLGFVGSSDKNDGIGGRYGLESYYNQKLQDDDIHLTIDRNIQSQAEKVLEDTIKKFNAPSGSVIVQDPRTGKILAMGSYPNFDPNNYSKSNIKTFLNPNIQSLYEPGSVFKVITMSAGIDSGKITPDTTFYDSGSLIVNGKTIRNWDLKAHGKLTMTGVIEESVNTGAAFAERTTGHDIFYNYLLKFGLDEPTGIKLPGEISGNLRNLKTSSRDINFATASFGQGVAVTPIQLISAISAIANDGIRMRPYLNQDEMPLAMENVISAETAHQVTNMMISAVDKAEIAHIPNYRIAGKTGTAQVADLIKGGYGDNFIHTYVGFAPATDPKFTVLIKVDKPQARLAGATVVPAFRELAQFILNYYNIPPDVPIAQ